MEEAKENGAAAPSRKPRWLKRILRWLKIVLILAVVVVLLWATRPLVLAFAAWVEGLGAAAVLVFIAGYVLFTVAMIPGSLLTIAAGIVFRWTGVVYAFGAAFVGAALAFLVSRYFLRSRFEKRFTGDERFATIDRAIGKQGLKIAVLLRLSPAFPFVLLNYALGVTKVRFLHYNLASLAMLPGTFLYVYLGTAFKSLNDFIESRSVENVAVENAAVENAAVEYVFLGVGLLATIVVTTIITRIARRALKEATEEEDASESQGETADERGDRDGH